MIELSVQGLEIQKKRMFCVLQLSYIAIASIDASLFTKLHKSIRLADVLLGIDSIFKQKSFHEQDNNRKNRMSRFNLI